MEDLKAKAGAEAEEVRAKANEAGHRFLYDGSTLKDKPSEGLSNCLNCGQITERRGLRFKCPECGESAGHV